MDRPVILDRRWDARCLLVETVRLFWRHKLLFITISALVYWPFALIGRAIFGEEIGSGTINVEAPAFLVAQVLFVTVLPALVTALHVVAVLRIAAGEPPTVLAALRSAAAGAPAAVGASVLYLVAVVVGLFALAVPGVWLAVRLFFAAQAAVVDRLGPVPALRRSFDLVRYRWWQTLGRLLLAGIAFGLLTALLAVPLVWTDLGPAEVVLELLAETIGLSLVALFGTLVFMDYRGHGDLEPPRPQVPSG